jgi:ABC-type transporter Mla subunit MlaD
VLVGVAIATVAACGDPVQASTCEAYDHFFAQVQVLDAQDFSGATIDEAQAALDELITYVDQFRADADRHADALDTLRATLVDLRQTLDGVDRSSRSASSQAAIADARTEVERAVQRVIDLYKPECVSVATTVTE